MEVIKSIPSYDHLKDLIVTKFPSQETLTSKPVVIAIGATVATYSTYSFVKNKFKFWKSQGVQGPEPSFPFGQLFQVSSSPFSIFTEWRKKHGRVYGIYMFLDPVLVISDAEVIKEIVVNNNFFDRPTIEGNPVIQESLINKNGGEWRHDRSILSPTFTSGKMKMMYPLMQGCFKNLEAELETLSSKGEEFNPKDSFTKLTSMVIARCAFATEVNAFVDDDQHPLVKHLMKIVTPDPYRFLIFILTPAFLRKRFQMHTSHPTSFNYIIALLKSIIKTRKENKIKTEYNDLLQLLLDTQSDPNGLSDDKIVANCFLFFLAGLETTAQALTYISFVLALNPEVQEKLYHEVSSVDSLDYESLFELKYLDAVINETLRLYPPAPMAARVCQSECTLSNGINLKAKTNVFISIGTVHRDEEYFPEPEKFDPSRFLPENKDSLHPGSFIPFVAGPRNCIGMRFALLEVKMTVAEMVLKYKFVRGPNTPDKVDPSLFSSRTSGITVKIEKRN